MISILICLILLVILIYRGFSVFIVSPLAAMLAVFLTTDQPLMHAWTGPFMAATAGFVEAFFPIFLVGAIFGAVMNATGAGAVVADYISEKFGEKRAMFAVIFASFLLTFGGISVFVVIFTMLPIATSVFIRNDFPRYLIPSAICAGGLAAYVAPGSAQFLNTIPIAVLNTNIYSGAAIGTIGVIIWLVLAVFYLNYRVNAAKARGEGYGAEVEASQEVESTKGNVLQAFAPIILVALGNIVLTYYFSRPGTIEYYQPYGGVNGIWPITISISFAILLNVILYWKVFTNKVAILSKGAQDSLAAIFNTATQVGFGGVIKSLPAFLAIEAAIFSINAPLILTVALGCAVIAGIVGSTSGGVALAMATFGPDWAELAIANGVPLGNLHRIILFGASVLDTLPHSGFIITVLSVCGLTHKQSYKDLFIVTCVFPGISLIAVLASASVGL